MTDDVCGVCAALAEERAAIARGESVKPWFGVCAKLPGCMARKHETDSIVKSAVGDLSPKSTKPRMRRR